VSGFFCTHIFIAQSLLQLFAYILPDSSFHQKMLRKLDPQWLKPHDWRERLLLLLLMSHRNTVRL
jgi:hypothetical protein